MTPPSSLSPILQTLRSFPAGAVYTSASKSDVLRGLTLYRGGQVKHAAPDADGTGFGLLVVARPSGRVRFETAPGGFESRCSCGGAFPGPGCEHIACALFSVKNLLDPSLFAPAGFGQAARTALLKALFPRAGEGPAAGPSGRESASSSASRYAIVLEKDGPRLATRIVSGGRRVTAADAYLVPHLLRPYLSPSGDGLTNLAAYFAQYRDHYPVFFREGDVETPLRWDSVCSARTGLDLSGEVVSLRKVCSVGSGPGEAVVFGDLAVDLQRRTLSVIRDRKGWEAWLRLAGVLEEAGVSRNGSPGEKDPHSFRYNRSDFEQVRVGLSARARRELSDQVRFRVDGAEVAPETPPIEELALRIETGGKDGKHAFLYPECRAGQWSQLACPEWMDLLLQVEWGKGNQALRPRKSRDAIAAAFLEAALQKDARGGEEAVEGAFPLQARKRQGFRAALRARKLLSDHLFHLFERDATLRLIGRRWVFVPGDRRREAVLLSTLFETFGPGILDGVKSLGRLATPREDLPKALPVLLEKLGSAGISLILDGLPVETIRWEFRFDASRSGIDWFEIRPEIRWNGELVGEESWRATLERKGLVEREGKTSVLDPASLQALEAVLRVTGLRRGKEKEVVPVPRLQILDWIGLRKSGVQVTLPPEEERVFERLLQFERIEEKPLPAGIQAVLRPYQKEGYHWLRFLYENRFGACLADDMGLGKTLQAICLLAAAGESRRGGPGRDAPPHLVVVPPSLVFNWEREIERFCPALKTVIYQGKDRAADFRGKDLVLTTYGVLRRDIESLKEIVFDVVVFDEAQTVKNIHADTTAAARQLRAAFRLALTGTPVENHIGEYYSIMDLVVPGLLGDYAAFRRRSGGEIPGLLDLVHWRTRPFILRRTKGAVLGELPPKVETDFYLDLTEKQRRLYTRTAGEVKRAVDEAYRTRNASEARIMALTALLRLRQICLDPRLLSGEMEEASPKIDFLKERLDDLTGEGHHALVFSQFTSFLDLVEKRLGEGGLRMLRLDGSTPVGRRKQLVETFQGADEPTVFLLSLKAGGQGLNLTRAGYVFLLDPWWNPAVENQASDRAHRIGQTKKVIVTRLLMRHTMEEKMMELKKQKQKLYEALLDAPEAAGPSSITREDFDFLLSGF
jgi:superfamily II DNA or RNA helicase